jgi:hypothetical protein
MRNQYIACYTWRYSVIWEMLTMQCSLQWLIFSINELLAFLRNFYNTAKGRTVDTISLTWEKFPTCCNSAMLYFLLSSQNHSTCCFSFSVTFSSRRETDQQPASPPEPSLAWLLQWKFAEFCSAVAAPIATRLPHSLTHEHSRTIRRPE